MDSIPNNRLASESSPYLRMHAYDLIDWFPWGREAIALAQTEQKPLLLSIGYQACYWCQQMQQEVFSHPEVAQLLNEYFINVKVDREEREEVEKLYLRFAQALVGDFITLPLNIFLTPDLKPFFAKGYTPLKGQFGSMGMFDLIHKVKELWYTEQQEEMRFQAERVVELFEEEQAPPEGDELRPSDIETCLSTLFQLADPLHGGWSSLPKALNPSHLLFLTRYCQDKKSARGLFYLNRTLECMSRGGLYDLIGGGFGIYSVERSWCVPHFEKLLADNALMAEAYLQAFQYTEKPLYKEVGLKTVDFIIREMGKENGGFYSSLSSSVEQKEGFYDTWSIQELNSLLSKNPHYPHFMRYYNISSGGNFQGRNLLHAEDSLQHYAQKHHVKLSTLKPAFKQMKQSLEEEKKKKKVPSVDKKQVISSNAFAVYSLFKAYRLSPKPFYLEKAQSTLSFIQNNLYDEEKGLCHYAIDNKGLFRANMLDYSALIRALIQGFLEIGHLPYLNWAQELCQLVEEQFSVEEGGYVFSYEPTLIFPQVDFQDKRLPSCNALHAENLYRLYQITRKSLYLKAAQQILEKVAGHINTQPLYGYYHLLNVLNQPYLDSFSLMYSTEDVELNKKLRELVNFSSLYHENMLWIKSWDEDYESRFSGIADLSLDKKLPMLIRLEKGKLGKCYQGIEAISAFYEEEL